MGMIAITATQTDALTPPEGSNQLGRAAFFMVDWPDGLVSYFSGYFVSVGSGKAQFITEVRRQWYDEDIETDVEAGEIVSVDGHEDLSRLAMQMVDDMRIEFVRSVDMCFPEQIMVY